MEMVRLVSSGTEATMSAIRLARGATGRDAIIKFDGCYHGHADSLLVKAGSGGATFGVPDSLGVPPRAGRAHPHGAVQRPGRRCGASSRRTAAEVAAVIVEPVAGNMGVVPPAPGFLAGLRELATRHGALLIFDEVITGFRVACGGAQARYGVRPDLTCLGKIIGGGLPVGAYGGSRALMERVAPLGRRLPGGHALRQPARGGRRARHAARARAPRHLRAARGAGRARRARRDRGRRRERACR